MDVMYFVRTDFDCLHQWLDGSIKLFDTGICYPEVIMQVILILGHWAALVRFD